MTTTRLLTNDVIYALVKEKKYDEADAAIRARMLKTGVTEK